MVTISLQPFDLSQLVQHIFDKSNGPKSLGLSQVNHLKNWIAGKVPALYLY